MKKYKSIKLYISIILGLVGLMFLISYIFNASSNIIYSDYIRLTNSYIDNVFDIKKILTADILTRMPISFLCRIINVQFFSYNLMLDKILSALFMSLIFIIFCKYLSNNKCAFVYYVILFVICFSLNQWEMLLNGSGYCHYIAYFLFVLYFYLISKNENNDKILNAISVFTILLVAGPYCATFVVTACIVNVVLKKYKNLPFVIAPFVLYLISNHFAVYEHSGMKNISLFEAISSDLFYPIRFILKSIASSVIGVETYEKLVKSGINSHFVYVIGFVLFLIYIMTFLYLCFDLFKNNNKSNLFILSILILGIGNILIVFLGRFSYMNDSYGMQSRYYLQYMVLNIAVVLFFSNNIFHNNVSLKFFRYIASIFILLFLLWTTTDELKKAPSRKASYENMIKIANNIDNEEDDVLPKVFEYHHEPQLIRDAFNIIKSKKLNIYNKH